MKATIRGLKGPLKGTRGKGSIGPNMGGGVKPKPNFVQADSIVVCVYNY